MTLCIVQLFNQQFTIHGNDTVHSEYFPAYPIPIAQYTQYVINKLITDTYASLLEAMDEELLHELPPWDASGTDEANSLKE